MLIDLNYISSYLGLPKVIQHCPFVFSWTGFNIPGSVNLRMQISMAPRATAYSYPLDNKCYKYKIDSNLNKLLHHIISRAES